MEKLNVVFVHGFWGLPADGHGIQQELEKRKVPFEWQAPHLWEQLSPHRFPSLPAAAEQLTHVIHGRDLHIVAYSLGGRVVLHWPEAQWDRIASLTLISVHGGLNTQEERQQRRHQDQVWSEKFLNEAWDLLVNDWNAQDVFRGDVWRPRRLQSDFVRADLSQALRAWSLAAQDNKMETMKRFPFPVTYWVGEKDTKFSSYAQILKTHLPKWHVLQAEGHGHSLHGSAPERIVEPLLSRRIT